MTTISSGTKTVTTSDTTQYTVLNGATLLVSGTNASVVGAVVSAGGFLDLFSGTASNTTLSGGDMVVSGGNTAKGVTLTNGGVLELVTAKAAVTGAVTFGSGANVLQLDKLLTNGNVASATLTGFGGDDKIEIAGTYSGDSLSVTGTSATFSASTGSQTFYFASAVSNMLDLLAVPNGIAVTGSATTSAGVELLIGSGVAVTSGETLYVNASGAAASTVVSSGGALVLSGAASDTTVTGGGTVSLATAGATLTGGLTFSGGGNTLSVTAIAASGDGDQAVISGFQAGDKIVLSPILASGAQLTFSTSGGNEIVTVSGGGASESFVFSGTTAYNANTLTISSAGTAAALEIANGGVTISVTTPTASGAYDVGSGNTLLVLSGGSVSAATIESSGSLVVNGGADTGATVVAGGSETVLSGSASGDLIAGSAVVFGGALSGATISSGGALTVSGGVVSSTTVRSGGTETVVSGGSASGDTISGALVVNGGTVSGETIVAGGSATFQAGAVDSGAVVSAGAKLFVSAATGSASLSGDKIYGTVSTVLGDKASFTNETVYAGGVLNLLNSNNATGTTVSSGGLLFLSGAETATDTTLAGGATVELSSPKAALSGSLTFENGDNTLLLASKLASATYGTDSATLSGFSNSDQILIGSGLFVTSSVVSANGLLSVTVGGAGQDDTLVFAGGGYTASEVAFTTLANGDEQITLAVPSTSTLTSATASGAYALHNGATLIVAPGGVVSAATVGNGATLQISGGLDNGAVVAKGGVETVLSGSAADDVVSGSATVSGGSVQNETVASGGVLTLDGGATSGVTLGGDATLDLASGATLSGPLTFSGGDNSFVVSAGADPSGALISGYRGDDKIDVAGVASATAQLSFTSNSDGTETVTVSGGGVSETFHFASAAAYTATTLGLAADGTGVDLVRLTTPTIAFTTLDDLNTNQASYTVHGTVAVASDPYAVGQTVDILENGQIVGTGTVGANGYWSANVQLANANGDNLLTASVTDKAGVAAQSTSIKLTADVGAAAFTLGNLVLSISGDGDGSGVYGDNQASPITLEQVTTSGTIVSQLVLPETTVVVDGVTEYVISGEYGSSSEGTIQLSADGHSLTIAGYGVDDALFNASGATVYGNAALAQSTSISGGKYTAVARVIADVGASGVVDDSTSLYNIFNVNNPRSVVTVDGSTFFVSGQGDKNATSVDQGVYTVASGTNSTSATYGALYTAVDTRDVEIYGGDLYVSIDSSQGVAGIYDLGNAASLAAGGAASFTQILPSSVTLTAADANAVNGASVATTVNLSPENFFFANATTLYVADGGAPKAGGLGDGGLQKWSDVGGTWQLDYTLSAGLTTLVAKTAGAASNGDTGLIGLTGTVNSDGTVTLYATTEPLNDLGATALVALTDNLSATSESGETFTTLLTASAGENIRGVAFAPSAACFCTGVKILTSRGEVAVEALRVGDEVVTVAGALRPIRWIGRRALDLARHAAPERVQPYRVRQDAFGPGLPKRDLWLSPDHNIAFEGALIPVAALENGRSVAQMRVERVVYWHVELDAHDVLYADGLPSESYLDTGNRTHFENGGAFVTAHPDFAPRHWRDTCLPLALDGEPVARAKAHLLARLADQGCRLTDEADPHLLADGRRIDATRSHDRLTFRLPPGARDVQLMSRTFTPAHAIVESRDTRELGLCVGRLEIDGAPVALDAAALDAGWGRPEYDGDRLTHRWTTGAARLPAGARHVGVELYGTGRYWSGEAETSRDPAGARSA